MDLLFFAFLLPACSMCRMWMLQRSETFSIFEFFFFFGCARCDSAWTAGAALERLPPASSLLPHPHINHVQPKWYSRQVANTLSELFFVFVNLTLAPLIVSQELSTAFAKAVSSGETRILKVSIANGTVLILILWTSLIYQWSHHFSAGL